MAYNIFISHSWNYSDAYEKLLNLLNSDPYFYYHNYSIPKDDPVHTQSDRALRQAIANQMQLCSCILVLAGIYASYSDWIQIEIDIAKNHFVYPKKIIAVECWGAERTSQIVKQNADRIVGWSSASIINAIRELSR